MAPASGTISVVVAHSPSTGRVEWSTVELPVGSTIQDALRQASLTEQPIAVNGDDAGALSVGIWGRISTLDARLRDGDRVELYRALTVDPKEARRLRYKRHREKTTAR